MCSGVGQCIAEKRGIYLSLGLEKPTSLSLEKKKTLSRFRLERRKSNGLAKDVGGMAGS